MRLSLRCSTMWADQPNMRAAAKVAVKNSLAVQAPSTRRLRPDYAQRALVRGLGNKRQRPSGFRSDASPRSEAISSASLDDPRTRSMTRYRGGPCPSPNGPCLRIGHEIRTLIANFPRYQHPDQRHHSGHSEPTRPGRGGRRQGGGHHTRRESALSCDRSADLGLLQNADLLLGGCGQHVGEIARHSGGSRGSRCARPACTHQHGVRSGQASGDHEGLLLIIGTAERT